ncbi:MAG: hypothetical protein CMQ24_05260 [Gammaproteobacteria bacterium]|nr:hypothetical protein [Gammaproteobacteria bacterium]
MVSQAALATAATVLFDHRMVGVAVTLPDATDLWVRPKELPRVNGFELKPEGACLDEICVPVRQDVDSDIFVRRGGAAWFNVSALARRLEQLIAADYDHNVFSLGALPVVRSAFHRDAVAPDFSLPDLDGNAVRLSDCRISKARRSCCSPGRPGEDAALTCQVGRQCTSRSETTTSSSSPRPRIPVARRSQAPGTSGRAQHTTRWLTKPMN